MTMPFLATSEIDDVPEKNPDAQREERLDAGIDLRAVKGAEVAKTLERLWEAQDWLYNRPLAEGEVYERQRDGESNVWVSKSQDLSRWVVYIPPGIPSVPAASFNLADRLISRLASQIYADEPVPEAEPATGSPEDRDAAEFATRVLLDIQSEANLDDLEKHRRAFDFGGSWGSGYIHYLVNPRSGGRVPVTIQASPFAVSADEPFAGPAGPARPEELTLRYETEDGGLTDEVSEAKYRWLPRLDAEVYAAKHIRFIPTDSTDLWDAEGVVIGDYITVRKAKLEHEIAFSKEQLEEATKYRPSSTKCLLPRAPHRGTREPRTDEQDERLVLRWRCYWKASPAYPDGVRIVTIGKELVARESWIGTREDGSLETLDLPLTQVRHLRHPHNPHGTATMKFVSGANEQRLQILAAIQDHMDRVARRKTFVPVTSTYQPGDAQLALETHIPIAPGQEPRYEEIPPLDQALFPFYETTGKEMRDAVGLQETGAGLQVPSITSGRQALAVISQVHAGLSEIRQNAERAYIRGCRIQLQLVRFFYPALQRIKWCGEDGEYKEREWVGSDLGSSRDVRIRQGSFTMLAPLQKVELAFGWAQHGAIPPDQVQDIIQSKIQAVQGLQDNPHLLRVRRQIEKWRKGPPEGWQGQPMPEFQPTLADFAPNVAMIRLKELGYAMASSRYGDADPVWRQVLDLMYQQAQQSLMPVQQAPPGNPQPGGSAPPDAPVSAGPAAGAPQPPKLQQGEAAVLGGQA